MRYMQIDNGVAIGYTDTTRPIDAAHMILVEDSDDFVGWSYVGGSWVEPEPIEIDLLGQTLTRRQVRAALALNGIDRDAIPNAIAAIPDAVQRDLALIDWEDAPYYVRTHPLFSNAALLATLGLDAAAIDALWAQAINLPA